jgi:hypothetical protein
MLAPNRNAYESGDLAGAQTSDFSTQLLQDLGPQPLTAGFPSWQEGLASTAPQVQAMPPVAMSSMKMPSQDYIAPTPSVANDPNFSLAGLGGGGGSAPPPQQGINWQSQANNLKGLTAMSGTGSQLGGTVGSLAGEAIAGPQGGAIGQMVGNVGGSIIDYFASSGERARRAKAERDAKVQADKMRRMQEASQAKAQTQADENRAMAMDDRTHNLDLQRQREQAIVAQSVMNVLQNKATSRGLGGLGVNETSRMGAAPILTPRNYT